MGEGCIHTFDAISSTFMVACSKCGDSQEEEYRRQRDDLSEEMERCHKMLDAHYDEPPDTVSADTLEQRLTWLLEVKGAALSLLDELADPDGCRYDHHGYCQAHSLHERPCPHERAKEMLAEERPDTAEGVLRSAAGALKGEEEG